MSVVVAGTIRRHTTLRWVGVGLFFVAFVPFVLHVSRIVAGDLAWYRAIPCFVGFGLSLAAFGANDDTALYWMRQAVAQGTLPSWARPEWIAEVGRRPERVEEVHASPKASILLPIFAALAIVALMARGLGMGVFHE